MTIPICIMYNLFRPSCMTFDLPFVDRPVWIHTPLWLILFPSIWVNQELELLWQLSEQGKYAVVYGREKRLYNYFEVWKPCARAKGSSMLLGGGYEGAIRVQRWLNEHNFRSCLLCILKQAQEHIFIKKSGNGFKKLKECINLPQHT